MDIKANIFKTNFIYIKHSYLIFIFIFIITIFGVILNRMKASLNDLEQSIGQGIFDIIFRLNYSFILTFGWRFFKHNNTIVNLLFSFTQIIDTIISMIYYKDQYGYHSTLRRDFDHINDFDISLGRIRYSFLTIMYISYYFYSCPLHFKDINRRTIISLSYILIFCLNLLIFYGLFEIFIGKIVIYIIMISYDIYNKKEFINSHSHFAIMLYNLLDITFYLPETFIWIFNLIQNIYMEIFILFIWYIINNILEIALNKLIQFTNQNLKTLMLFPFYFSIELYTGFIFLDREFFTPSFFAIFFFNQILNIIQNSGLYNFIVYRLTSKDINIKKDISIIMDFTMNSELNIFCERLALFSILIFIFINYIIVDLIGMFDNTNIHKSSKTGIMAGYSFIFFISIISDYISCFIRSKMYLHFLKKLKHGEIENINSKFTLSKWKDNYFYIILLIVYIIMTLTSWASLY